MATHTLISIISRIKSTNFAQKINSKKVQRPALVLAASLFFIGLSASVYASPSLLVDLQITPLAILLGIGVPLTITLNGLELHLTGRLVGTQFGAAQSLRIAVVSGAANMLPLPGGALVRMAAMKGAGARYRDGGVAILAVAIIWIGVAFPYAAVWMLPYSWPLAAALLAFGVPALGLGYWLAGHVTGNWWSASALVCLKLILTVLEVTRLFLCFWALNISTGFAEASVLAAAGVTGAAVSIVPAGLGVREAVSAGLASFVGLSAAAGFLAPALDRLLVLAVLAPLALMLAAHNGQFLRETNVSREVDQ